MKKFVSILLAALLMMSCLAEGAPVENIIPVSETATAEDYENARELVRLLFVAAAGTDEDTEVKVRKRMTSAEQLRRNDDAAYYRKTVLPWLMDVLTIDDEKEISRKIFLEHFVLEHITDEGKYEFSWDSGYKVCDYSDDMYDLLWDELVEEAVDCLKRNEFGKEYIEFVSSLTEEEMTDELLNQMTRGYFRLWIDDIDPKGLKEMNGDFTFWLYSASSPAATLDYPVVKHTDNDYYMHRMFNDKVNAAGTLFMDYRNLPDLTDENTIVYGHNMNNDSMFGTLDMYEEQAYYESHPYMLVIAEDEIDLVEVYTAFSTDSVDVCYEIAISEFLETLKYVKGIGAKTYLKVGIDELLELLEDVDEEAKACLKMGIDELWNMLEKMDQVDLKVEFIEAFNNLKKLEKYAEDDQIVMEFIRAFNDLWQLMRFDKEDVVKTDFYNGSDEFMDYVNASNITEAETFFYEGINDYLTLLKFIDRTGSESDFVYTIMDIRPRDRILTLSTCTYEDVGKRYVVEGRLLNTWFTDEKWGDVNEIPNIHDEVSVITQR